MNDVAKVLNVIKMSMKDDDRPERKELLLPSCYFMSKLLVGFVLRRMLQQIPIVGI
jgi:hypothetical protein